MTAVAALLEALAVAAPGRVNVEIRQAEDGYEWHVLLNLGTACGTYAQALAEQRRLHLALSAALADDLAQLRVLDGDGDPWHDTENPDAW